MKCETIQKWTVECLHRDESKCQMCGKIGVDVHHIIPRRFRKVKYDTDNGISLCRDCHLKAHRKPKKFKKFLDKKFGKDYFLKLWTKANKKSQQFRKEI